MKRAEILERTRIRIDAVIETNRADRELVAQASAYRITHVIQTNIFRRWQKVAGIHKDCALQFPENWERVLDVEYGIEFSTDGMTVIIVRAEIALAETPYSCGAAIIKAFVDRNRSRFVGAAGCKRMNNARASAE